MQMIHSVHRLQESIDSDEWRHISFLSSQFGIAFDATTVITNQEQTDRMSAANQNLNAFCQSCCKVHAFFDHFKKPQVDPDTKVFKGAVLEKMTAPILTRWWTVGADSSYIFDYYLLIFHACQTVVNMCPTTATPNAIASDLFSMMTNQENFIDVTCVASTRLMSIPIFDWLQSSDDLTGHLGFQSHQMVVQHFFMCKDLQCVCSSATMDECRAAVALFHDAGEVVHERHLDKPKLFISIAAASLKKHFPRWMNQSLLPARLMSESPFAKTIAAVMLGVNMRSFESDPLVIDGMRMSGALRHKSTVHEHKDEHKDPMNLVQFNHLVQDGI